ncbi:MAG: tryptophan synthase subunit alpha [Rectinemataceae bacterium]
MSGIDRITGRFEELHGRVGLMTHAVVGYPDLHSSARIFSSMASSGASFIEAQLPFSDPTADGPSIVQANHTALRAGSTTFSSLDLLTSLRKDIDIPILIMSYLNPLLAFGIDAILDRAARDGFDGFIVPDYPDDESELDLEAKCAARGLALVPLIAPATSLIRARALAEGSASPFIYAVMRLGVTGRKTEIADDVILRLGALREATGRRVAAGFGIREGSQIAALAGRTDCAIVGSALIDAIGEALAAGRDPAAAVGAKVRSLVDAQAF